MGQTISKIGKYDVVEILGKGGMGVVYKATDSRIGRLVAIKMMTGGFADNPDLLKRFYREAQATGMLQHPNIVIIYDLGDQDGNPYIVMEYLEGDPMDKVITSKRDVSLVEKLNWIIQACNGLNYAHQRGIVHRDIKPANIIVLRDGSVKILDFGIARMGDKSMTRTGQVVGTITYMSPEQINAQVVDGRSDIFSTGVMLYELLTGALPFEGKDTASTLLKIIHEPPPPLKNFLPVFPPELEEVMHRALCKDREERYATAEDFAFDLSRVQEQLKKQMVSEYVERAKSSIEKADLPKAKELLQQVLRVDTQHTVAKDLMLEVQHRLQKQQRGEQVRQLRSHAEDALAHKQYEDALAYVDQALSLDKTNTELLNLRDLAQEAKVRIDKLQSALRRAEQAQQAGDLEAALKAAEDALAVDSDNTQAKSLHTAVAKELSEHKKQAQVQGFLDEARKDISQRKFTAAFDALKKAEEIDASSPEVHALLNLATSGREQEQRRRDLERFANEIEDALARDAYEEACTKADQALAKFSNEPGLLKLKAMADKQREAGQKKKFVEEQMAVARKLLDAGKAAEALATLEKAAQKIPGDSRLQGLLAIVRDSAEREKAEALKAGFITKAKEALRKKDYATAVKILEQGQAEIEGSAEIGDLLQFARDEAVGHARRRKIDQAAEEAQKLMAEEEYERAVALLEATMKESPDEEVRVVLTEARRHVEEFNRKVESAIGKAQRLLDARKIDEAVTLLESQPKAYARSQEFCDMLEKVRAEQDQVRGVRGALDKAREALGKADFANASTILEACKKTYGETPEVKQAFAEFDSKRTAMAKTAVDKAVRDARTLLLARQYQAALDGLKAVAALVPAAPADLQKQFETLNKDAAAGAGRQQKEAELGKTIVAGSAEAAQTMIAGSVEAAGRTVVGQPAAPAPAKAPAPAAAPPPAPAAAPAAAAAPKAAPAKVRPAAAPVAAPPSKAPLMAIIAVVAVLVLGFGGYVAYKKFVGPPPASTYIEINGIPWGTVKSITSVDGKVSLSPNEQTPARIAVPPGDYKVVVDGPDGQEQSVDVKATDDIPGSITPVFQQIDVDQIINATN
jgi:serine/threonine-protein kinase